MRLVITIGSILLLSGPAFAGTICATVRPEGTGFVDLRGGPTTDSPGLAKLRPGEQLTLIEGACGYQIDATRQVLGQVCAPEGSGWLPVDFVPRFDRHYGWVKEADISRIECPQR